MRQEQSNQNQQPNEMGHLAAETLQAFRRGELAQPESVAAAQHLASCQVCQAAWQAGLRNWAGFLPQEEEHLSYEELRGLATWTGAAGTVVGAPEEWQGAVGHVAGCPACAGELAALQQFVLRLGPSMTASSAAVNNVAVNSAGWSETVAGSAAAGSAVVGRPEPARVDAAREQGEPEPARAAASMSPRREAAEAQDGARVQDGDGAKFASEVERRAARGVREREARPRRWLLPLSLAAVALVAGLYWGVRQYASGQFGTGWASPQATQTTGQTAELIITPNEELARPAAKSQVLAEVIDGKRQLRLMASGMVEGAQPEEQAELRRFFAATPQLAPLPEALEATGPLPPSATTGRPQLQVLSPVAVMVASQRVKLQWRAQPGAAAYNVTVMDLAKNVVAEGKQVRGTSWTTPTLAPGKIYSWSVQDAAAEERVSPKAEEPEARFGLPTAAQLKQYAAAVATGSQLRIWLAARQAGLKAEAEAAETELRSQNPNFPPTLLPQVTPLVLPSPTVPLSPPGTTLPGQAGPTTPAKAP